MRYVAYLRVSTADQDSLTAQLAACRDLAARLGGTITEIIEDKLSGLDANRPGYQRLLTLARDQLIDAVLVYRQDRFGRDPAEALRAFGELSRLGIEVQSASEPNIDQDIRGIFAVLAGRESRIISERVRSGMREKARTGQWQTTAPPGYRIGANHHLEPDEQATLVIRTFETMAQNQHSLRQLRDLVSAWGLKTSKGTALSRTHLHQLLTNPAYVGKVVYGMEPHGKFPTKLPPVVCENAHPGLVDQETFDSVQAVLKGHKRFQAGIRHSPYLLTGLLVCGHCGIRM
jgi:site-specific DNA recombinase